MGTNLEKIPCIPQKVRMVLHTISSASLEDRRIAIKKLFRICFFLLFAMMNLNIGGVAFSQQATMADIMMYMSSHSDLPEYCQVRLAEGQFRHDFQDAKAPGGYCWPAAYARLRDKWMRVFGWNWVHVHHYCFGITKFNKANRMVASSLESRKEILESALGEFQYVENGLRRSVPFPLWDQLYMYRFQIYSQLGRHQEAQIALKKALAIQQQKQRKK